MHKIHTADQYSHPNEGFLFAPTTPLGQIARKIGSIVEANTPIQAIEFSQYMLLLSLGSYLVGSAFEIHTTYLFAATTVGYIGYRHFRAFVDRKARLEAAIQESKQKKLEQIRQHDENKKEEQVQPMEEENISKADLDKILGDLREACKLHLETLRQINKV